MSATYTTRQPSVCLLRAWAIPSTAVLEDHLQVLVYIPQILHQVLTEDPPHSLLLPTPHNLTTAMVSVNRHVNFMVLTGMLSRNEKWSEKMNATNDQFFPVSAQGQYPKVSSSPCIRDTETWSLTGFDRFCGSAAQTPEFQSL